MNKWEIEQQEFLDWYERQRWIRGFLWTTVILAWGNFFYLILFP